MLLELDSVKSKYCSYSMVNTIISSIIAAPQAALLKQCGCVTKHLLRLFKTIS